MNTSRDPRYVILAAIDDTPAADLVLAYAVSVARRTQGAELHILHVPARFTHEPITPHTFDLEEGRRYLDTRSRAAYEEARVPVVGHLLEREPVHAILQVAVSIDADVIVVGPHDTRGPKRWLLGSVAQKVMSRASCPVLVARPKAHVDGRAPEIEPPCPDCLKEQRASRGAKLWCARHSEKHPRAHLHYEIDAGFGAGSELIKPE